MKLWIISSSYPRHPSESINAGVLARDVALGAVRMGHDVEVVTPDKPGGVVFDDELSGTVIPWPDPTVLLADIDPKKPRDAFKSLALLLSARRTLKQLSRTSPPDGIIALWALPSGMFARWASRWASVRYVTWILGSDVWAAPRIPFGSNALRRVLRDSAANYADGAELAAAATDATGRPVDILWSVRQLPEPSGETPARLDVLYVGRYHHNKGPDVLLDALAMVPHGAAAPRVRLHGQGDLESALAEKATAMGYEASGVVRGPIAAQALADQLENCGVLVIPSRLDSVPMVLADAVQAGTAVVVTDVGDMGRLVRKYRLGLVVQSQDPGALAEAISEILSTDRYPNAEGLEGARRHFSISAIATTLIGNLEDETVDA